MSAAAPVTASVEERWRAAWPGALAAWSAFTLLRDPHFLFEDSDSEQEGMKGQIAAIRLVDQTVMVNLKTIAALGIEDFAREILAHEIGHHVFVPGNLSDYARMIATMRPVFQGMPNTVNHMVANLYGDLMINDRLQHQSGLDIAGVYERIQRANVDPPTELWRVYTRTYEHLWRLKPGTLAGGEITPDMNADAALLARLIRHYSREWLRGVRRFSYIIYPYLARDEEQQRRQTFSRLGLADTGQAGKCSGDGQDGVPDGLSEIDASESGTDDAFDAELAGKKFGAEAAKGKLPPKEGEANKPSKGQFRQPFEYGELLKALGLDLSQQEVTARYYRERVMPYLIPFPAKKAPQAIEPLAEGYDSWESGEDLDDLDMLGSVLRSPQLIPGFTTVKRVYGDSPGADPARVPADLDLYIDCSGSMPNPAVSVSYLALAGAILALSAMRAGARVQATLWSGPKEFETSGGFIRDEKHILNIVAGYIAGSTAFPLHVLRDTYKNRKPSDPPVHIVIVSDEGADTILNKDEQGTPGRTICQNALKAARGGATMVLNLSMQVWMPKKELTAIGFKIYRVTDWEQLLEFSRAFVLEHYGT